MHTSLLNTKLYIPKPTENLISRPELINKINEGINKKLTLICSPAGFGKTTLLSEWSGQTDKPVAWLSLDKVDNNPGLFIAYLVKSLNQIKEVFFDLNQDFVNSKTNYHLLFIDLINEISEQLPDSVLILDDFHFINNETINEAINFFIDNLPDNLHLVISSRTEPDLKLSKLRMNRQINEIRVENLRFSAKEEKELLAKLLNIELNSQDLEKLNLKTEGWVVGIQFAALAMQDKKNSDFISDFDGSNNFISDYLTDEVLSQQDEEVKDFLLKSSVFNYFNSEICNYVLNITNSKQIIKKIKENNLFLIPLDDKSEWFRYHHLFRDLLFKRLKDESPEIVKSLNSSASKWFEEKDLFSEALYHATENKDMERFASLLDSISVQTLISGDFSLFKNWAEFLPENVVENYPYLCLCLGWINCLTHNLDVVETYINYAEKIKNNQESETSVEFFDLDSHINLLRAYYYTLYPKADLAYFMYCIDLILKVKKQINDNVVLKGVIDRILGGLYLVVFDWQSALKSFKTAQILGKKTKNNIVWLTSLSTYSLLLVFYGKLSFAKEICEEAINEVSENFKSDAYFLSGYIYQPLAKVCYEFNQIDKATEMLKKSINFGEKIGNKFLQITAYLELSLILKKQSMNKDSLATLNKAEFLLENNPIYKDIFIEFNLLKLWLIHNKNSDIDQWYENYLKEREQDGYFNEYKEIILCRILIAKNNFVEAKNILESLNQKIHSTDSCLFAIEALLLYSFVLKKLTDKGGAIIILKKALSLASEENYLRIFVDEKDNIADLLYVILNEKDTENNLKSYLIKIIEIINTDKKFNYHSLPEPLSERELEILRLMATGITNQSIADKLFVAIGTIKKHTNSIYYKLNVETRVQAIQKAREINLI